MRIGVSGASGYVGRALLRTLHDPVVCGRRSVGGCEFRPMSLEASADSSLLDGLDGFIHLAADTSGTANPEVEARFAASLARCAAERGIPLVVASSQVAAPDAPSPYGRSKAAVEAAVLPHGARIVRPGLVYGGTPTGLFGQLAALVDRLPCVPWLLPDPMVQPVHVEDLVDGLVGALTAPAGRVYVCAGPPVGFSRFLRSLARARRPGLVLALPVPVAALHVVLAALRPLLGPRFAPERLDSLLSVRLQDGLTDAGLLRVTYRGLDAGLTRSGRERRLLLQEGAAMMASVVGDGATPMIARRYVRALENAGVRTASFAFSAPWRLESRDRLARGEPGSLGWRSGVAARVAESTARLAPRFIRRSAGLGGAVADLAAAGFLELRARIAASLFRGPRT